MNYVIIIVASAISFLIGRMSGIQSMRRKTNFSHISKSEKVEHREALNQALDVRTETRKEVILDTLKMKVSTKEKLATCDIETEEPRITRNEVESLVKVSGQTALKYLNELEEEGRVIQVGSRGQDVYYVLNQE
ncbi:MAG: Fic family protein [Saprospiraceae bacterium]|jgi:Fic family protein